MRRSRSVPRWLARCALVPLALVVPACGDGDDDSADTVEAEVEAEVEAAYLHSWEVYAEAVHSFDTSSLAGVFAEAALAMVTEEVERLRDANTPLRTTVDHDYVIDMEGGLAVVTDSYVNHSVLLDGSTGEPAEADPNNLVTAVHAMREIDGEWKVIDIDRQPPVPVP